MPSPVEEQPGLLIRDSFRYSDAVLIIPPPLVQCLAYFDGKHTDLDLRQFLVEMTGDFKVGQVQEQLAAALAQSGFLVDETYRELKAAKEAEFAAADIRVASHAGAAYPDEPGELAEVMEAWMDGEKSPSEDLIGIAAPHVSPGGGYECYQAAYGKLAPSYKDRTFVVLGTSHYGAPSRFGLTRKPYVTPFGSAKPNLALLQELMAKAPDAIGNEDYCHAVEHSIEFQVLFLQQVYGPDIQILPILCGSFAKSIYEGGLPEDDENVKRFIGTLGEIGSREGKKLCWVMGVDMAHMGVRYGDNFEAIAGQEDMSVVEARDLDRIGRLNAGDDKGFWERIQYNNDDLKWCGSSPLYTFMKAMPGVRGTLEKYEQWNIDEQSVVSFAGVTFR